MSKSIIIIGAGLAGLAAGCYGQMNGYKTRIFEMHDKPGGVCTAWKRKGYTIDGCIHWLVGSREGKDPYYIWEELGAVQGRKFVDYDEFGHIEDENGKSFTVYTNIDRLEQHMKELAPEDSKTIEEFTKGIRYFTHFSIPWGKPEELYTVIDTVKFMFAMIPHMGIMRKWMKVTTDDYSKKFKNPFLRNAFRTAFIGDIEGFSIFGMLMCMAWMHMRQAGYPLGGSLEFSRAIEKRYLDLGGEINYRSGAKKIIVENNQASGIVLNDGTEHRADIVISAADGHSTIFDMLDGLYINDKIRNYYDNWRLFSPLLYISLGVNRSFEGTSHHITYMLDEPVNIGGKMQNNMGAVIYNFDPSLAPEGRSVMIFMLGADYEYWNKLRTGSMEQYEAEKQKAANQCIDFMEKKFPGFRSQVEMIDVATPETWVRYTGNWKGSYEGWLITTDTFMKRMSKELPGLKNFYMVGQWVEPGGGVPSVAMSGRNVIQIICSRDKKPFITIKP